MLRLIAIDPGTEQSAAIVYDPVALAVVQKGIVPNAELRDRLKGAWSWRRTLGYELAIEGMQSFGMPVGKEVFETAIWIGRFLEAWDGDHLAHRVYRMEVKMHLCGNPRAKDKNIRAALVDVFGPGDSKAIGTKKAPGPLYGISKDLWSALAIAVTYCDTEARLSTARVRAAASAVSQGKG